MPIGGWIISPLWPYGEPTIEPIVDSSYVRPNADLSPSLWDPPTIVLSPSSWSDSGGSDLYHCEIHPLLSSPLRAPRVVWRIWPPLPWDLPDVILFPLSSLGGGRSELHIGSGLLAEPNAHGQHLGNHVKDEVVVRKMDPRPIYFGFWCLMINTTKLD
jgi:hypothetical protein